jgi:carbon monoxide dehydrogenase subunit G
MIDVSAEIEIAASPADIAAVMFDPQRYSDWMKAVQRVEVLDPALAPGARVRHHGSFMGKDISWTTEVETIHFPHVLALKISDGPFVGTVRYGIQRSGAGSRVQVQNSGELKGLSLVPAMLVKGPMKSALDADLARLKALIEEAGAPGPRP